jgi:CheY-like chemotaxis protein
MVTSDLHGHHRPDPKVGRILVVDDEDSVRNAFVRNLQVEGFEVVSARTGPDGLAQLRTDRTIVLVLLDLVMSGMDGWTFRDEQLKDPSIAGIPTIIMTGSALHQIEHDRLKATDYLLKPVGRDHLVSVVMNYCKRKASA